LSGWRHGRPYDGILLNDVMSFDVDVIFEATPSFMFREFRDVHEYC
jgi:hypothetical protein